MASLQCVIKESSDSRELFGFEDVLKNIEEAIIQPDFVPRSNIAIIAEPFSGRSEIIYKISELCREQETKIFFSRLVSDDNFIDILEKSGNIVLVDNCQYLFSRKIGGFEKLDIFLNTVALSNKLFITTWNQFSWNYLRFVYPLESIFPVRIELPRLGPEQLKKMVMANCEWQMTFAEDAIAKDDQCFGFSEFSVVLPILKRSFRVPLPRIDYFALKCRIQAKIWPSKQKDATSVEDRVFLRLKDVSEGNPGVAQAIWKKSVPSAKGAIKPEDIIKPQYKIDINYSQAYLLYIILCRECVTIKELKGIIDPNTNIDRSVYDLERGGLISVENELASIRPEALHSIESYLKSMRLVW
jgi:hypothetical protein